MNKTNIVGFTTDHFVAHLCGNGVHGNFFLIKFRKWDGGGNPIVVENCCAFYKDDTIKWFKYPLDDERQLISMIYELNKLSEICSIELKSIY